MPYDPSDSSGTDDDLPPAYQNRGLRGRISGNERPTVAPSSYPGVQSEMEVQIHQLEQEAYTSVLRAFKAQSDAITWEKESLITELRKELRVSDKEHRELLSRVNADDVLHRIREWRKSSGPQVGLVNNSQPGLDAAPSPSVSASRKRQKTSRSIPSMPMAVPSPALHPQPVSIPVQPSSSIAKKGSAPGPKMKKPKPGQKSAGPSTVKTMQYPPAGPSGRGQLANRNSSGAVANAEPAQPIVDPLIGRKVFTRWPDDNNFYEAVITDYNEHEGLHALVYDINTANETWEWVNLKEISPEDIRWDGEDTGNNQRVRGPPGHGGKKPNNRGGAAPPSSSRGRGSIKNSKKDSTPAQNGIGKSVDDIELLHTETLIKEIEKILMASNPDPAEIEKAKKALKEHEQSLVDAIARLAEVSDGESDERPNPHQEHIRGWRSRPYSGSQHGGYDDTMAVDGHHMTGDDTA